MRSRRTSIAKNPPIVVQGVKSVLNYGMGRPVAEGLAHVALHNTAFLISDDLAEAMSAFMEKRDANFRGT